MVDFISEVQEELRKDDYNKWLKQYGPYIAVLIAALIIGTGAWEWNKSRKAKEASLTSNSYVSASNVARDGNIDQAIADFMNISETAPSGYSGLSLMRAAELELQKGNSSQAVALLDQAANIFERPRHADLARMKAAYILASNGHYADVSSRAANLAQPSAPYEYLARELLGFSAYETGDMRAAREQFAYLERIPGVPETVQQRAKQYLDLMQAASETAPNLEEASQDEVQNLQQTEPVPDFDTLSDADNDPSTPSDMSGSDDDMTETTDVP